ncbi:hypothetical protein BDP27DRAFT_1405547 [Rhodocollybia butyracea]|uniref:Uncharacterized protein n=1 Tax=Rhodocollybia butyracea TaxID=206335 RepID=A0A9P5U304_9AGAR|nr:hypothetical protein BDP27DRAFT_1405547 [Rhodocollybia butyracea]
MSGEKLNACPHIKVLPKGQRLQRRGTIIAPCKHRTPHYLLGWTIPFDDICKIYPGAATGVTDIWLTEIQMPWFKSYGHKYRDGAEHCYRNPDFLYVSLNKADPNDSQVLVFISHNRDEESIAMAENQEFIDDMRKMTFIDESVTGELKWLGPHELQVMQRRS